MRRSGLIISVGLLLTACGQQGAGAPASADQAVNMEIVVPSETAPVVEGSQISANATSSDGAIAQPRSAPRVAYAYRYALELPVDRAPAVMARHEQACVAAGTSVCQVIGSETSRVGQDDLNARLEIRATPAYIDRFKAGLPEDAKGAGGRIASATTESEDLTRSLIDSEARLRAQTTLRDRLQGLLATRNGSLEDLLKVESELARVQGEIDAAQSTLREMQTRVATSRLTIEYAAAGQFAPDSAFRPVVDAVKGALSAMMTTLGVLITVLAILLPIGLIVCPLIWFVLKRRRAAKAASPPVGADQA